MRKQGIKTSRLKRYEVAEGERLERVLARMMENGEPIGAEVGEIYTERNDGIMPAYNIRTDRFEVALDGMDKIAKSRDAKRAEMTVVKTDENDGEAKPTQGTDNK